MSPREDGESPPSSDVSPGFVAVGRVLGPWGVRGDVKVASLVDHPDRLAPGRSVYLGGERRIIERCRWQKGLAYLKLSGIDDPSDVEPWRGQYLEVPEADLQPLGEGEYYHFQLVGLAVRSTKGLPLGKVTRIISTSGTDVFVVHGMMGEILVPAVDEIVKKIDLDEGVMVIEVIPGLLPSRRKGKPLS
ncbi:MAG: 16S rRNA processing protein RimM [Chloroflexi bacterium]|nr:16S rRNA processing protein RimM [Chloroflexota bacterium]